MQEMELKILDIDCDSVQKNLYDFGATKIFDGELLAFLWDFPDGRIKAEGKTFRLRKEGDETTLTFKSPIKSEHAKISKELEIHVSDFDTMFEIITSLGFENTQKTRKRRITWELGNVRFEFDKYHDNFDHIPEFMEIEAENLEDLRSALQLLNIPYEKAVRFSSADLFRYYSHLAPFSGLFK